MAKEAGKKQRGRFPLHHQNPVSTTKKPADLQEMATKIGEFFHHLRNPG
jgi:hypothetical protein